MAIAGFTRTTYKSGGSYATGRVQYITRQGPYQSQAEARVLHQGLEADGAQVREDLVWWNHHNLPQWAQDDPVRFFRAAEQHERAGGVAYTEWRFALPRELSKREQLAAARAFLQAAFGRAHGYCWAFHNPDATDGGTQPHVHVLWSARTLDGIERSEEQFFRRYNRADPARGGAEKSPRFAHFGAVMRDRELYCDIMNIYLEKNHEQAR